MHVEVMLFSALFINFTSLDTSSAESSGTTVACSEMPEHNHSRGGGLVLPSGSHCSKCSNKPHRRTLVTGVQWAGGWGCCFGRCHKVCHTFVTVNETVLLVDECHSPYIWICFNQADWIWAFHGWLASGERDEAASDTGRMGGWVFQIPAVSWIQNVRAQPFVFAHQGTCFQRLPINNSQTTT